MLRKRAVLGLIAALVVGAVAVIAADNPVVTLSGTVSCAKCVLKKADATQCQDVLVVTGENAGEYYLVKNAVSDKFGHVCMGSRKAKAEGTVAEKDGKKWLTATKLELEKS
jgi:hypothetical protein